MFRGRLSQIRMHPYGYIFQTVCIFQTIIDSSEQAAFWGNISHPNIFIYETSILTFPITKQMPKASYKCHIKVSNAKQTTLASQGTNNLPIA